MHAGVKSVLFLLHHKNPSLQFRIVGSFEKALSLLGIPTICSNRARSMRGAMVPATRVVLIRRFERCSSGHDNADVAMLLFNFFDRSVRSPSVLSYTTREGLFDLWSGTALLSTRPSYVMSAAANPLGPEGWLRHNCKRNVGLQ